MYPHDYNCLLQPQKKKNWIMISLTHNLSSGWHAQNDKILGHVSIYIS